MTKRTSILPRNRACAAALARRASSSWAAVGSKARRFTSAQPTYFLLASPPCRARPCGARSPRGSSSTRSGAGTGTSARRRAYTDGTRRSRLALHQAALGERGQERHDLALHLLSRLGGVLFRQPLDDRVDGVLARAQGGDVGGGRVQHEPALGVEQEIPCR